MKFKAAIFDLDGTLLDTLAGIADSMNGALVRMGFPVHDLQDYRFLTGDGVLALVTNALPPEARRKETIDTAGKLLREEYIKNWDKETKPYEGIPELLDALSARSVRLNILSNKMDEFTRQAVDQFLGRWAFDFVLGEMPGFPRKPDPTSARHIVSGLGLQPSDVAFLGDTSTDMKTALRAGLYPIGALWGFRDKEELLAGGARAVIASPLEIKTIKEACGADFTVVTPGIRVDGARDDQKRTATPLEAVTAGADFIVVGRPVLEAKDPIAAARKITEEIEPGKAQRRS